ncbi:hypothetical protein OSTOST_09043 [Ostertagia ostertagi]
MRSPTGKSALAALAAAAGTGPAAEVAAQGDVPEFADAQVLRHRIGLVPAVLQQQPAVRREMTRRGVDQRLQVAQAIAAGRQRGGHGLRDANQEGQRDDERQRQQPVRLGRARLHLEQLLRGRRQRVHVLRELQRDGVVPIGIHAALRAALALVQVEGGRVVPSPAAAQLGLQFGPQRREEGMAFELGLAAGDVGAQVVRVRLRRARVAEHLQPARLVMQLPQQDAEVALRARRVVPGDVLEGIVRLHGAARHRGHRGHVPQLLGRSRALVHRQAAQRQRVGQQLEEDLHAVAHLRRARLQPVERRGHGLGVLQHGIELAQPGPVVFPRVDRLQHAWPVAQRAAQVKRSRSPAEGALPGVARPRCIGGCAASHALEEEPATGLADAGFAEGRDDADFIVHAEIPHARPGVAGYQLVGARLVQDVMKREALGLEQGLRVVTGHADGQVTGDDARDVHRRVAVVLAQLLHVGHEAGRLGLAIRGAAGNQDQAQRESADRQRQGDAPGLAAVPARRRVLRDGRAGGAGRRSARPGPGAACLPVPGVGSGDARRRRPGAGGLQAQVCRSVSVRRVGVIAVAAQLGEEPVAQPVGVLVLPFAVPGRDRQVRGGQHAQQPFALAQVAGLVVCNRHEHDRPHDAVLVAQREVHRQQPRAGQPLAERTRHSDTTYINGPKSAMLWFQSSLGKE